MARTLKSDKVLFLATLLLVGASVVMVYSASAVYAMDKFSRPDLFLIKQGMWAALGIAVLALVMRLDYRHYREPAVIWSTLAIVGVALVAVLFSRPINSARRWFGVGGIGIQPSEVAKVAAIFFVAALLERRVHRINDVRYSLSPIAIVVGALMLLILLEPDYGTAVSLGLVVGAMIFAAGISWRYLVGFTLCTIPLAVVVLAGASYRRRRLLAFLNPWDDPLGDGWQIIQSQIAIGTGGVFGKGLMAGVQKLFYLPEAHTDFIFSVISEELGLVGATVTVICFGVITWRGLRIALRAPDTFGAFLAVGLTTMIAVQAFINITMALGLLPTKGIPLPFVSNGGSSLLINLLGMGILLNVSQHATSPS